MIANQTRRIQHRSQLLQRIARAVSTELSIQIDASEQDSLEAGIALARMTDEDRELLMLAAWEGLTSTQLACVLGCSSTAARIRLPSGPVAPKRRNEGTRSMDGTWRYPQTIHEPKIGPCIDV